MFKKGKKFSSLLVCLRPPKKFGERSSGARPRVGPQFAEISARATGILAIGPARLLIEKQRKFYEATRHEPS